jgi:O-antigen/teichoic acid export membrane protein
MTDDPLRDEALSKDAAEDIRVVAKGGAVQIAGQLSQRGLSFVFSAVALQFLGTAGYGLYRLISQVLSLAAQVGLAGFNYASMRFITRARATDRPGGVKGAAQVGLAGAGIASIIVCFAAFHGADLLAGFFATPKREALFVDLFRLGILYVPLFALMQVLRYCTQAYKTMVPSVVAGTIVQPAARFVFGVGALIAGLSFDGVVGSLVLSVGAGALVAGWYFTRMLTAEERSAAPVRETGPMIRFALPQAGASLFGVQSLGLGILVLGALSSEVQVALFAVSLSVQGSGTVFLGGIVNIWAPVVSDLFERGEIARLDSLYKTINRWTATFSFPVFAVLILEGDLFVRTFFPKAYPGAVTVVAILAIGNFFYTGTGPTGYVISMTGRPGLNFVNSIVAVGLYAGLGYLIVPRHGAVGMAVVDAFVTASVNTVRVIQAKVLVGVQPFGRSFIKPVVATLAGSAFLFVWSRFADEKWYLEVAGIAIAAGIYIMVLKSMGLDAEERHVWDRIRKKAFKRRG